MFQFIDTISPICTSPVFEATYETDLLSLNYIQPSGIMEGASAHYKEGSVHIILNMPGVSGVSGDGLILNLNFMPLLQSPGTEIVIESAVL